MSAAALDWAERFHRGVDPADLVRLAFDRWHRRVYEMAHRILGSAAEAEEVTQDVFETLIGAVSTLSNPAGIWSYLVTCTVRAALRRARRALWRRRQEALIAFVTGGATTGREAEALAAARQLLDRLPARERVAVVLRHVEGQTIDEIAEHLGLSVATVHRLLDRARRTADGLESRAQPGGRMR